MNEYIGFVFSTKQQIQTAVNADIRGKKKK